VVSNVLSSTTGRGVRRKENDGEGGMQIGIAFLRLPSEAAAMSLHTVRNIGTKKVTRKKK